ncbi:MAG: VWA-like domain-containing protein [Paracoccaceae bacterium]
MTRHSVRATTALRALNEQDPAMAALALWCDHRDRDHGPAAETAGQTIHYGPEFDTLPRHEQMGLAAHHILHVALRHSPRLAAHALRMGDRFDNRLWQIAADAIVNETLLAAGYAIPRPALTLTGLLASALDTTAAPRQALADWDVDRLYHRLRDTTQGAGGDAQSRALSYATAQGFQPDIKPDSSSTDTPDPKTDADWHRHLSRALDAGRLAGRGIGAANLRLADIPVPETPWEVILRRLLTRATLDRPQPTHRRPARRFLAAMAQAQATGTPEPAFQPGLARHSPAPRVVIALDTSSSLTDDALALLMAEVAAIARRTRAELHLIPFDDSPAPAIQLDPVTATAQLRALQAPRGGGTAFAPAFAKAAALAPSILIVLTDLEAPLPPRPRFPVIWAVPDARHAPRPDWGTLLDLSR